MNILSKEQNSLVVAVLSQKLAKAYCLLSPDKDAAYRKLTQTGRSNVERFANELCEILILLGMPTEELNSIRATQNND
jgi:hypothetical protein